MTQTIRCDPPGCTCHITKTRRKNHLASCLIARIVKANNRVIAIRLIRAQFSDMSIRDAYLLSRDILPRSI